MGFLFSKLCRLFFSSEEHKVIIVGLDNAGKTTILYQFLMNEVVHTSPTIGSNVEEIVWKNMHFLMWDIGGQDSLRASWDTYYANTEFVIIVIDSTDRERLVVIKEEIYRMLAHEVFGGGLATLYFEASPKSKLSGPKGIYIDQLADDVDFLPEDLSGLMKMEQLKNANVLLFANKQDLKESMTSAEISQQLNLTSIKDHGWHIQACCGLTGEGLFSGLEWIVNHKRK